MADEEVHFTITYRCLRSELSSIYTLYLGKFLVNEFILADGYDEYRYVGFVIPQSETIGQYVLIPQLTRKDHNDLLKIKALEKFLRKPVNPEKLPRISV